MSDQSMASASQPPFSTEQLQHLLTTLLHAERAGVRVCLFSRTQAPGGRHRQLLQEIQRDEAKSCLGLINSLKILGCVPDKIVGDFAQRCLAIENFTERLRFLNRGQGWVAKKIHESLPQVQHPAIQQQLADMLEDHRRNVNKVNNLLSQE